MKYKGDKVVLQASATGTRVKFRQERLPEAAP